MCLLSELAVVARVTARERELPQRLEARALLRRAAVHVFHLVARLVCTQTCRAYCTLLLYQTLL